MANKSIDDGYKQLKKIEEQSRLSEQDVLQGKHVSKWGKSTKEKGLKEERRSADLDKPIEEQSESGDETSVAVMERPFANAQMDIDYTGNDFSN